MNLQLFQDEVWAHYRDYARDLPWRTPEPNGEFDPYKILVSEVMLQQTQVQRVIPKYLAFTTAFPTLESLASAPLAEVLRVWSGLGYNRRAKYLWETASQVVANHNARLPLETSELIQLPGIGVNTAAAVTVYAYNTPMVFIETNIRTVFIYHFFNGQNDVSDKSILSLVADTIDNENPREWYWALMDYGTHVKQTQGNHSRYSKHHTPQSKFAGSTRQIRGQVIRLLTNEQLTFGELAVHIQDDRLANVLDALLAEGLIRLRAGIYSL